MFQISTSIRNRRTDHRCSVFYWHMPEATTTQPPQIPPKSPPLTPQRHHNPLNHPRAPCSTSYSYSYPSVSPFATLRHSPTSSTSSSCYSYAAPPAHLFLCSLLPHYPTAHSPLFRGLFCSSNIYATPPPLPLLVSFASLHHFYPTLPRFPPPPPPPLIPLLVFAYL